MREYHVYVKLFDHPRAPGYKVLVPEGPQDGWSTRQWRLGFDLSVETWWL